MTAGATLVKNGTVLTMDAADTVIDNGAVVIQEDRIAAVGTLDAVQAPLPARVIDARGGIVMPGLVNTHTHAAMTCFRGLADDLPLKEWLNDHIFPAEARLDRPTVHDGTLLACAEMMLSGTTCFCDMYLFADAVAAAARQAGMRAVVGEVLYDFPSPHYGPIEKGLAFTEALIQQWRGDTLVRVAVEPHSPYLCSPDLLKRAQVLAARHGCPLVIHVAETHQEVEDSLQRHGRTPVGHLAALGVLDANLLACHCVVLNPDDITLLKQHNVKVAHNPESNMKLASGVAPVPALLKAGVCVGLGTDGCASNNNLDLFAEMGTAARLHKVTTLDPTVLDARTVLRMATIDGAAALGLDHLTGSIEVGKKADLIVIDCDQPHLTPMYSPFSHAVYAVKASDVVLTIIDGKVVAADGRLTTIDMDALLASLGRIAADIGGRNHAS